MLSSVAGKGELHFRKVRESVQSSLERLKIPKVKALLAARHDEEATVAEIAGVFNGKVKEGFCEQWGVCDFDPRSLSDITKTADKRGWVPPKVYQGRYGALHRRRAERIFDFLEERKMTFLARSVSALPEDNLNLSSKESAPNGTIKFNVYDMPEVREAIQMLKAIEDMHGITPRAASLRWLSHHSKLRHEDGIILESATFEELQADVKEIKKGALPDDILKELDRAWHAEEDNKPNGR
jgi:aflatoxin B1 aldehyde reductase